MKISKINLGMEIHLLKKNAYLKQKTLKSGFGWVCKIFEYHLVNTNIFNANEISIYQEVSKKLYVLRFSTFVLWIICSHFFLQESEEYFWSVDEVFLKKLIILISNFCTENLLRVIRFVVCRRRIKIEILYDTSHLMSHYYLLYFCK